MDIEPIGWVSSPRSEVVDDDWDAITAQITLDERTFSPEALLGLDAFSHIEVVYQFDRVATDAIQRRARHPRDNHEFPLVGIFAQRAKARPNRLGVSVCRLLEVQGLVLTVQSLDAIDGTPVLDIKPYMAEFGPRGEIRQPDWSHEVMAKYWDASAGDS